MANNYIQAGCIADLTNTTATPILSGQPTPIGTRQMAVALVDILPGATGSAQTEGVFLVNKAVGSPIMAGQAVFWNATTQTAAGVASPGDWFIGWAFRSALLAATTVEVALQKFSDEGPRLLMLPATGASSLTAADLMGGHTTVLVANTAAKTVALPSVATVPLHAVLRVKKAGGGAFAITLDPASSETINGGATYTALDADGDFAEFQSDGTAWQLINSKIA